MGVLVLSAMAETRAFSRSWRAAFFGILYVKL